ncbi:hypothetical protein ACFXJ6_31615 [Streptomyces sp. NPDC059218]|uniref:hypothetical protein n=1 Tax=unclassified Streptomyces TaxID=2593676 RepID=UPI003696928A
MTGRVRTRPDRVRALGAQELAQVLREVAALITENAGLQTYCATRALDPQGEPS